MLSLHVRVAVELKLLLSTLLADRIDAGLGAFGRCFSSYINF